MKALVLPNASFVFTNSTCSLVGGLLAASLLISLKEVCLLPVHFFLEVCRTITQVVLTHC